MQDYECSKGMSKSETGLWKTPVRAGGNGHRMGKVGQGRALLSDGTLHGDVRRTGVERKGLDFNLYVAPCFGTLEKTVV